MNLEVGTAVQIGDVGGDAGESDISPPSVFSMEPPKNIYYPLHPSPRLFPEKGKSYEDVLALCKAKGW